MKRYTVGNCPNINWNLNADLGNNFENYVASLIVNQLSKYHPTVLVQQTKRVGDGGKDIVVVSTVNDLEILGQKFYLNGKEKIKIFFECKSTNDHILRYDKIVSSSSRVKYQNIDYYVLVTNSSILPYASYFISEDLKAEQIVFKLIDGYLLGKYIASTDFSNALGNPYVNCKSADFYYEYQVELLNGCLFSEYAIYFFFRNYNSLDNLCDLQLVSDVDWEQVAKEHISFIIPPNGAVAKKVIIRQNHFDGIPQLSFRIQVNETESSVIINGINGTHLFKPRFIGEERKQLVDKLISDLKKFDAPSLVFLGGDAGIGKTRITEEIIEHLIGTNFDFGQCKVQKESSPEKQIYLFLKQKGYLNDNFETDFSKTIEKCAKVGWRAIYVIDDFHNAEINFINEIKKLKNSKAPITFIICGRTDFSAGSLDYVSFVQWTEEKIPLHSFNIAPLTDEDTKNLIRTLIEGIPEFALERLFELSMNNPLFIVQFIEYLLDTNLVKLVHRNTVGIVNINSFHSKIYIPSEISKIYCLRIENLLEQDYGKECLNFLFKLAICNGSINSENINKFFENDIENIDNLLDRRLLKLTANGDITFIHESFFLFIDSYLSDNIDCRKSSSTELLNINSLPILLDNFQIGKINLFAKKYDEAEIRFKPILLWLDSIENFSNNNVNINYYDYLLYIPDLLCHNEALVDCAQNALSMRIYITLHHFAPIKAVHECDKALKIIGKNKLLNSLKFELSILELKAHALMNSGLYLDGETLLKELQAQWLCDELLITDQTLFDLFDRLSSVYRHFNLKSLAEKYNNLSIKLAKQIEDSSLVMLALRTKFKIYLYEDINIATTSLQAGKKLSEEFRSARIDMDNDLDLCGLEMLSTINPDWKLLINKIDKLCLHAKNCGFNRAIIHGYFLLAICNLKCNDSKSIQLAKQYTEKAINYSAAYGIAGYMWRLHNLNAIIQMRLNYNADQIYKEFCTVYEILNNRGLLFIGNRDFTHGNMFAISNYGYYLQEHQFESLFYEKIGLVTYIDKNKNYSIQQVNNNNKINEYLVSQYKAARDKNVLFVNKQPTKLLRDDQTNYIIVI